MLSFFLDFINPPLKEKKEIYHLALFPNKSVVYGYSIHGLWVDYVQGGYPQYCKKVTYNEDKLAPLMDDMETYWKEGNHQLWKHEWVKHGSCFKDMDEYQYFKKALDLYHYIFKVGVDLNKCKRSGESILVAFDTDFNLLDK